MILGLSRHHGGIIKSSERDLMRVLVFEDSFDIEALLTSGGVDIAKLDLRQFRDSSDYLTRIAEFEPEVLMLDHFMPPFTGLQVLQSLIQAVAKGAKRPEKIIAISSASMANERMRQCGADLAIRKDNLATLEIWPRIST
jgi:CheY-like chemotaxis protein